MNKIKKLFQESNNDITENTFPVKYIISYDLKGETKDYSEIIEAIKKYKHFCKPLESVWIIESSKNCFDIFADLSGHIDDDDKLMVISLGSDAAWTELTPKGEKWMKNKFPVDIIS